MLYFNKAIEKPPRVQLGGFSCTGFDHNNVYYESPRSQAEGAG
ncbi:hypothetical protein SELSPUOL_01987 [Selenomonas sputigena ATCC 35185]|uniref:Uncharacterized protein n=1 Tax=Selenomonas sputigena (strain ATCC 35185 / DSM 20758 / CCUG 44933 / VPI D19B-28) TaxID=546271 RepID=C9LWY1_SELS3|nr:hypothetical protein SELSPUOL_01987 [Selenomonas sputigena ATCC 35185]